MLKRTVIRSIVNIKILVIAALKLDDDAIILGYSMGFEGVKHNRQLRQFNLDPVCNVKK